MSRAHPYDQQLAHMLKTLSLDLNDARFVEWRFCKELLEVCLERHNAKAVIALNEKKRRFFCLTVENGFLVEKTFHYWILVSRLIAAPREESVVGAFLLLDGSLRFIHKDGSVTPLLQLLET